MSSITIPQADARIIHVVAPGAPLTGGPFSFPFPYFSSADLFVIKSKAAIETLLTLGVDYTVVGVPVTDNLVAAGESDADDGFTSANITLAVPDNDYHIGIWRWQWSQRVTDFPIHGWVNMAAVNLEFDRVVMMLQDLQQEVLRTVRIQRVSNQIPPFLENRNDGIMAFDSIGNPVIVDSSGLSALLPQATETQAGIAEIATSMEVLDGSDDSRIVTPLKLRQYLDVVSGGAAMGAQRTIAGTTYTIAGSDAGFTLRFTANLPVLVTVPATITTVMQTDLFQAGNGIITVAGAGSAVLESPLDRDLLHRSTAGRGMTINLWMDENLTGTTAHWWVRGETQATEGAI